MNLGNDARPEHVFYCSDGSVLKNLRELAKKLRKISQDAYGRHVNGCKNDFYSWIKDIYGNEKLAKEVAFAGSSAAAALAIEKALAPKPRQKKRAAKRKKAVVVKRKRTGKMQKRAKKTRKAAAVAKKKAKSRAAWRKKSRKAAKRKTRLHHRIHRHLKRMARKLFL